MQNANEDEDDSWLEGGEEESTEGDSPLAVKGELVSKFQLHKLTAISPITLDKYFREGAPVVSKGTRREGWKIDTARFIAWLRKRDVAVATGDEDGAKYDQARGRDKEAQARLREFDLYEKIGVTITRLQAADIYAKHVAEFRKRLLEMESQVPNLTAEQRAALNSSIDLALAEFSGTPELGEEYDFG